MGEENGEDQQPRWTMLRWPGCHLSCMIPFVTDEATFAAGSGGEYPLIGFPRGPSTLTSRLGLTQVQAAEWAAWLNQVSVDRQAVAVSFFEQAGAPVGALGDEAEGWLALGQWMYRWFPLVAEPFMARGHRGEPGWRPGYFQDDPNVRFGAAWAPPTSRHRGHADAADTLLHSVAVDLALRVAGRAQAVRPGLRWQASSDPDAGDFFVTPDSTGSPFPLIRRVRDFLIQATARPRGRKGHELRQWRTADLYRCYQRATAGVPLPEEWEAFPGSNEYREGCRYPLVKPPRSAPGPHPDLVAAVSAFRQAGWFQTSKLDDAQLAATANATWHAHEGQDIMTPPAEAAWRLLMLDRGRTWSEDVDADARPGDNLHDKTLTAITEIGGPALRRLCDAEELWTDPDGDVQLRFRLHKRDHVLPIPAPGRHLSPALITGLNAVLPDEPERLWFADHGPPIAIVTRATISERDELQRLTGLQVSLDPPRWWTALAPLPPAASPLPAEEVRQTASPDEESSDYWERVPAEERYLLGVEVASGEGLSDPFDWLVTISAREYFRDDPLGLELQRRLENALLAVPGVTSAENASWETWYVSGKASGEALCQAAAGVVDELADRMRAGYNAMFGED